MPELVLELFSEEIPARMQAQAAKDLERLIAERLRAAGVVFSGAAAYATPRRLTLHIPEIALKTEPTREEIKGPRVGVPAKALEGFLRKTGLQEDQLERRADKKGETYFAVISRPGQVTAEILAAAIPEVIRSFPWPKSMRWGAGDLRWVRPLRSILCILVDDDGAVAVPDLAVGDLAGGDLSVGAVTYGHRFLSLDKKTGAPKPLTVKSFKDYKAQLKRAKVLLDPAERQDQIAAGAKALAAEAGLELVEDPGLLREVTGLVEHPVPLMGAIEAEFQELPPEVLQTSMKEHQKFFSVRDPKSGKITNFITIANIEAADGGATIIAGNERVLRARLSDAAFFYRNDLATPLEGNVEKLAAVTFHNQLGSEADRVIRLRGLAAAIAPMVGAAPDQADRAALLAKADLVSEMVYEFPELQGLMGRYYAEAAGEPAAIATAIELHYAPLGPSDAAPTEPVAIAVALAAKIDALAGFWTIGAKPTGSGDPFALRRAALGVIRIVLENGLRLPLAPVLAAHAARLEGHVAEEEGAAAGPRVFDAGVQADLLSFIAERLKVFLRDPKLGAGMRHDAVDAVYALSGPAGAPDDLLQARARIVALNDLLGTEDGANLLAAFKRANNILVAEEAKDGVEYSLDPQPRLAEQPEEKALFAALDAADEQAAPALAAEDYPAAMAAMAALRPPLDAFFEAVVVNAEAPMIRRNRLCLLNRIRQTVNQVADFSRLDG